MPELDKKMNEYHLVIEEVLGGMDLALSRLDQRVNMLEKDKTSIVEENSKLNQDILVLQNEVSTLKENLMHGLNLALRNKQCI